MNEPDAEMIAQNDHLRAQLTALDRGSPERLRRFILREIRCQRCGDVLIQIVATKPYRVVRHRTTAADGAAVRRWLSDGVYTSTDSLRLDRRWAFFPIADDEEPDENAAVAAACRCGQFSFSMAQVLSSTEAVATPTKRQ